MSIDYQFELFEMWCRGEVQQWKQRWRMEMSQLTDTLARLKTDVANNTNLIASIVQQNQGFAAQLRAIANAPTTGDDTEVELLEFANQLEGDATSMAAAVAANTAPAPVVQAGPTVPLTTNPVTS